MQAFAGNDAGGLSDVAGLQSRTAKQSGNANPRENPARLFASWLAMSGRKLRRRPLRIRFPWLCVPLFVALNLAVAGPAMDWWRTLSVRDLQGVAVPAPERWLVAVFLDPECPIANGYVPVVNELAQEFSRRGFRFVGVYTDPSLARARLQQHAREYHLAFIGLDDRAQKFARFVGATYSAEAVVLDAKGTVLYRGRIDDRVGTEGAARPAATRHDLRDVLTRIVGGEAGPFAGVPGFGCSLAAPVGQR